MVVLFSFALKGEKKFPFTPITVLMIVFTLWTCVTTAFGLGDTGDVMFRWEPFMKMQLMTFITLFFINSPNRLHVLVWVIAISAGFWGVSGGTFTILTGGNYRVFGPEDSFFGDNNAFVLVLIIILPLLRYLQISRENKWIKLGLMGTMMLSLVVIPATYSRAGFLALGVVGAYF